MAEAFSAPAITSKSCLSSPSDIIVSDLPHLQRAVGQDDFDRAALLLSAHQMLLMQSVEHAAEPGWVNLQRYLRGKPLGLTWQVDAALRLLREPAHCSVRAPTSRRSGRASWSTCWLACAASRAT